MSVEKYLVNKEAGNFTVITNNVIKGLKNKLELLGFYLYLLSLPPNWVFHKAQIRDTCGIGIKKLDRFIKELAQVGLVTCYQMRNENGEFSSFELTVLNGESFNINGLDKSPPFGRNCRSASNGATVKNTYKRNIDKTNKEQIQNIEREEPESEAFTLSDFDQKGFEFNEHELSVCRLSKIDPVIAFEKFKTNLKKKKKKKFKREDVYLWVLREVEFKQVRTYQ